MSRREELRAKAAERSRRRREKRGEPPPPGVTGNAKSSFKVTKRSGLPRPFRSPPDSSA